MNRTTIIKALVLVFSICMFSRSLATAQLRMENLTSYNEKDGLPGMQVDMVMADKKGYIWTGTINGLARFDGYGFQRFYFDPNDSSTIHGLIVWSMFEDRQRHIWTGNSPSYLNRYDPATRKFRQYRFSHLFPGKAGIEIDITAITQDDKGRMYFGASTYYGDSISHALLYMDEGDTQVHVFPTTPELPINNIWRMFRSREGEIWLLTFSGILKIDRQGKLERFHGFDGGLSDIGQTADIVQDSSGHLWLPVFPSTLLDYDPATGAVRKWPVPGCIFESLSVLLPDKDGSMWIGASNGLFRLDRSTGNLAGLTKSRSDAPTPVHIRALCRDGFGNLWLGTEKNGLMKYEEKERFRSYVYDKNATNSLTSGWANILCEASNGKLLVATGGPADISGLNIIDPGTWRVEKIEYSKIKSRIGSRIVGGLSSIWEETPGRFILSIYSLGRFSFDLDKRVLSPVTYPGISDSVIVLNRLLDDRGDEWFCTYGKGIYRRKHGETSFVHIDLSGLPGANPSSNTVTRAVMAPNNGIWFLTDNGLFLFDPRSEKLIRHGHDRSKGDVFITQDINSLYDDGAGVVWAGTWQGGLGRYDLKTGRIRNYTRNDGLPSNSIQGIVPDEKNHSLWLSTFEGISRMDLVTERFSNYSIDDGLQGLLFADGSQLKTSKGLIAFGGANGLTIFDPDSVRGGSASPKVFLTELKLFNKAVVPGQGSVLSGPINETDSIMLSHDQNNLTIEYVGIQYSNPSLNRYAVKMENYDAEWREVGNQRVAYYPSLPPGQYVFRVKAANDKGIWNEKGASLHITILPPWWRTIWAYVLYGLLLALLAFGLDRYFRARIVTKERERNQERELAQAREIQKAYSELGKAHEELKSTQTQLVHSEKMASLGELTAGIAHEIQNPLNFVNNFAEINRDLIVEVFDAQSRGDVNEVQTLLGDIRDNEGKIRHHGLRADAIVKSMLQHSRASTGQKEPTDLAALADEYLKLAFHGMRAKDKAFNVTMETDFEAGLPKVNVIPQDIGRVLLNLYNNAFQAVMDRKNSGEAGYEPKLRVEVRRGVTAETQRRGETAGNPESRIQNPEWITLRVTDNGPGIPDAIRDKIFQPFFTTKPTGQGTGLGLSLSYDIVQKGHGGELDLESAPGEGATFIVRLPLDK